MKRQLLLIIVLAIAYCNGWSTLWSNKFVCRDSILNTADTLFIYGDSLLIKKSGITGTFIRYRYVKADSFIGDLYGNTDTLGHNPWTSYLRSDVADTFTVLTGYTLKSDTLNLNGTKMYDSANVMVRINGGNTFSFGTNAGRSNNSIFIGAGAGEHITTTAGWSNFIGLDAGHAATNALASNFIGCDAGFYATNAAHSNFFGYGSGGSATNAAHSNFFGNDAGVDATNATHSNFFGYEAGKYAANAAYSILIGRSAGGEATGEYISAFGDSSGYAEDNSHVYIFGKNANATVDSQFYIGGDIKHFKMGMAGADISVDTVKANKRLSAGACYMDSASGVISADTLRINKLTEDATPDSALTVVDGLVKMAAWPTHYDSASVAANSWALGGNPWTSYLRSDVADTGTTVWLDSVKAKGAVLLIPDSTTIGTYGTGAVKIPFSTQFDAYHDHPGYWGQWSFWGGSGLCINHMPYAPNPSGYAISVIENDPNATALYLRADTCLGLTNHLLWLTGNSKKGPNGYDLMKISEVGTGSHGIGIYTGGGLDAWGNATIGIYSDVGDSGIGEVVKCNVSTDRPSRGIKMVSMGYGIPLDIGVDSSFIPAIVIRDSSYGAATDSSLYYWWGGVVNKMRVKDSITVPAIYANSLYGHLYGTTDSLGGNPWTSYLRSDVSDTANGKMWFNDTLRMATGKPMMLGSVAVKDSLNRLYVKSIMFDTLRLGITDNTITPNGVWNAVTDMRSPSFYTSAVTTYGIFGCRTANKPSVLCGASGIKYMIGLARPDTMGIVADSLGRFQIKQAGGFFKADTSIANKQVIVKSTLAGISLNNKIVLSPDKDNPAIAFYDSIAAGLRGQDSLTYNSNSLATGGILLWTGDLTLSKTGGKLTVDSTITKVIKSSGTATAGKVAWATVRQAVYIAGLNANCVSTVTPDSTAAEALWNNYSHFGSYEKTDSLIVYAPEAISPTGYFKYHIVWFDP